MTKKILCFAVCVGLTLFSLMGCASTLPMTTQTVTKFGLANNQEGFKAFKYYLSRDITLKHVTASSTTGVAGGQGFSSSTIERDIIEFPATLRGEVTQISFNQQANRIELGVAFEESDDDVLWFGQVAGWDKGQGYFFLLYNDAANWIINYKGAPYKVTWGQEPSKAAAILGVSATQNDDPYANMRPLLLYKETSVTVEKEKRRTATGR